MDKWQKCPLIENCQQKSAVCNVRLPDETCYWFRWFRALDNPWHTGTPTEEGLYVCASANVDMDNKNQIGFAYWDGIAWYSKKIGRIIAWWGQKIEPYKEKEE